MKKTLSSFLVLIAALLMSWPAQARDTQMFLPIANFLSTPEAKDKLDPQIKLFFSTQKTPKVLSNLGSGVANPKTSSAIRSDEKACSTAFLSAILALQQGARQAGANAVIHIVSYYKKKEMSSLTQFECHAGGMLAGVALKGEFVKIAN